MSSRPVTVATSWVAFGFGWHGGGGCSAKAVRWVMITILRIAKSEAHRVRFAGLVPIFSSLSVRLIRFMFFSFPLVIGISFLEKIWPVPFNETKSRNEAGQS